MEPARPIPIDLDIESLLAQAHTRLEEHYGARFAGLVLHGSVARGTSEPESDIDLLVLLWGDLDYFQELRTLVNLLYPLQLDFERVISALPASVEEYESGSLQLYRNAAREGCRV
jgi:predicted nucleotidyltransferase